MSPTISRLKVRNVAVIGAGPAGLSTAKELIAEGHKVVVFERQSRVGGTWVYNPIVEADLLGLDPARTVVHSSLYASLRTNLPRELMGLRDFPFVPTGQPYSDSRRFPGHQEVLLYINNFATAFGLTELVRFETEVVYAGLANGKWRVRSRMAADVVLVEEDFDALVVCNGRDTEPRTADDIPGIDTWPGKQMHSHNYRIPEPFRDLVVILIGGGSSALDISMEIAHVAKEVHVASRSTKVGALGNLSGYDNLKLHSTVKIESAHRDGSVIFTDGSVVVADVILHCTGYKHHYPFLDSNGIVSVEDDCVGPLYKHTFPPALAPWLSFVGLPSMGMGFILYEFQGKWIAGVLSGRIGLPPEEEMMRDVEALYLSLQASATPKRCTHSIADYRIEYMDWLAGECGIAGIEEWRMEMYYATKRNYAAHPDAFRDEYEDEGLALEAHDDFMTKFQHMEMRDPCDLSCPDQTCRALARCPKFMN